jgi:hypothetical protein
MPPTIDDDVATLLERLRKDRNTSLNGLVNAGLRRGLRDMATRPKRRQPFRTRSCSLGRVRIAEVDTIDEVLATSGGEVVG